MLEQRSLEGPDQIVHRFSREQSRNLRRALFLVAVLMLFMALVDQFLALPARNRSYISLSIALVALLFHQLLVSQPRKWKSPLIVLGILVATTWSIETYGSVRSSSAFAFVWAVVVAGTYLRLRAVWLTATGAALLLGCLTWAETVELMARPSLAPTLQYWLMGSAMLLLIGAQLYDSRKTTDDDHLRHLAQTEERMRLEHERERSERRFWRIFQLNPTALMVLSTSDQSIVDVNPAFERSFAFTGDTVRGQSVETLWVNGSDWMAHRRTLLEQGRTGWQPGRWRRSDGQTVDVLVSSRLSEDLNGSLILTTVIDGHGVT